MCQIQNHYRAKDATRRYAWKVMSDAGFCSDAYWWRTLHRRDFYSQGDVFEATCPSNGVDWLGLFEFRNELHAGGFHCFIALEDAKLFRECYVSLVVAGSGARYSHIKVVEVEVNSYIASGWLPKEAVKPLGRPIRTACYEQMVVLGEAR